jgi:hypothetical protein
MSEKISPLKHIREFCLDCCSGSPKEVRYCSLTDCPIWAYRFGCKPKAAIHRLSKDGRDLLDESCFMAGARFDPNKPTSEMEV